MDANKITEVTSSDFIKKGSMQGKASLLLPYAMKKIVCVCVDGKNLSLENLLLGEIYAK